MEGEGLQRLWMRRGCRGVGGRGGGGGGGGGGGWGGGCRGCGGEVCELRKGIGVGSK